MNEEETEASALYVSAQMCRRAKRIEDDPEAILNLIDLIFGPRLAEESSDLVN